MDETPLGSDRTGNGSVVVDHRFDDVVRRLCLYVVLVAGKISGPWQLGLVLRRVLGHS